MTNWSDETVEKVAKAICHKEYEALMTAEIKALPLTEHGLRVYGERAKAALAAVAECKEVRELVEAAQNVIGFCRKLDLLRPDEKRLSEAIRPFTEKAHD